MLNPVFLVDWRSWNAQPASRRDQGPWGAVPARRNTTPARRLASAGPRCGRPSKHVGAACRGPRVRPAPAPCSSPRPVPPPPPRACGAASARTSARLGPSHLGQPERRPVLRLESLAERQAVGSDLRHRHRDRGHLLPEVFSGAWMAARRRTASLIGVARRRRLLVVLPAQGPGGGPARWPTRSSAAAIHHPLPTLFSAHAPVGPDSRAGRFRAVRGVTAIAVLLSLRRNHFIAVLRLLAGFATPALLSTGENRACVFFAYLVLLNVGLAWVVYKQTWPC